MSYQKDIDDPGLRNFFILLQCNGERASSRAEIAKAMKDGGFLVGTPRPWRMDKALYALVDRGLLAAGQMSHNRNFTGYYTTPLGKLFIKLYPKHTYTSAV